MLIAYGTACLMVILLAALHRPAVPYAFTLAAGWVLGFMPYDLWWMVSLAEGAVFCSLLRWNSPLWARVVAACVPIMLFCDGAFWAIKAHGPHLSEPYEIALNVLFGVQLLAAAWPGGARLVRLGLSLNQRVRSRIGGLAGLGHPARGRTPAGRS